MRHVRATAMALLAGCVQVAKVSKPDEPPAVAPRDADTPSLTQPTERPRPEGIADDSRTLKDVLRIRTYGQSVRLARLGDLRSGCQGRQLAHGNDRAPGHWLFAVQRLLNLDETRGCAQIRVSPRVHWAGLSGTVDLDLWVDVDTLQRVVIRPTRVVDTPSIVLEDEVHGLWLAPGTPVEPLETSAAGPWLPVLVGDKESFEGFVAADDLGLAFEQTVFEEIRQVAMPVRPGDPVPIRYSPMGGGFGTVRGVVHPVGADGDSVEIVNLREGMAAVGFVPRDRLSDETDDYEDVWGIAAKEEPAVPPPKKNEVDVEAGRPLYDSDGTPLGSTRDRVRLLRGTRPMSVRVDTSWGEVELFLTPGDEASP